MKEVSIGYVLLKDDKAWGVAYEDGRETNYGWVSLSEAEIITKESYKWGNGETPIRGRFNHHKSDYERMKLGVVMKVKKETTFTKI